MKTSIHETARTRRKALRLTQIETASRGGIQQRQVSLFEHGGDITLSTLLKITQALDMALLLVPKPDLPRIEALLQARRETVPATQSQSLLDRYQVKDDAEQSNG